MTSETPEPGNGDVDDLGLTFDDWEAIRIGYDFGTMEPAEGTVEDEAFRRLAAETRRETDWIYATREKDDAYQRCFGQPFPGGPLTAGLTSREAAELSGKLYSAHTAAQRAERDADWRTGEHRPFMEMDREIWDLYSDTRAETIVSNVRAPGEAQVEFIRRIALETPGRPTPTSSNGRTLSRTRSQADPQDQPRLALEGRVPHLLAAALHPASLTSATIPQRRGRRHIPARPGSGAHPGTRGAAARRPRESNRHHVLNQAAAQSVTGPQEG